MPLRPPAATFLLSGLVEALGHAAEATARATSKKFTVRRRMRRGATLRPGVHTPLWNEVVLAVRPFLRKYGEKAILARLLGVPRQRIHDYFVGKTACPDAERLLLLLQWLAVRRAGKNPA